MMLDAEHDASVHLDEAAIGIPGEARIGGLRERQHRLVVQAEVEDRVHHARHRRARAGAHRHEQRLAPVAENPAGLVGDRAERGLDLFLQIRRIGAVVGVEIGADLGGDGEAGRHGQAEARHLGEVGALAAEQLLHRRGAFGLAVAEAVHPFRHEPPCHAFAVATLLTRSGAMHNR